MNINILDYLIIGFYIVVGIQLFYLLIVFGRLVFFNKRSNNTQESNNESVSVVIVARNEYLNLKKFLPKILDQDYPNFEIILVNHASVDETNFLIQELQQKHTNLKYLEIKEDINFFQGKKFPLSLGIKSAKNDLILFTDADCEPNSNQWISEMVSSYNKDTEICLGYGGYREEKGLLNKIIRYDTIRVAINYLSFAKWGLPYMGVGRNLSYRKELFYAQKGFMSHYKISSGDDDLFINKAATRKNCEIKINENAKTISEAENSFSNWIRQKRRHLSTGKNYKFHHLLLLGFWEFSTLLFFILSFLLLFLKVFNPLIIALMIVRELSLIIITKKFMIITNERKILLLLPLIELVIVITLPIINMLNLLFKQRKWK